MNSLLNNNKKRLRGFSLLEMLVTMGIIAILIPLLSNSLVAAIRTALILNARSSLREELSTLSALMRSDIRNADRIIACSNGNTCEFSQAGNSFKWLPCGDDNTRLCKVDSANNLILRSAELLHLDQIVFEEGFSTNNNSDERKNILVTLVVSHKNTKLNIRNFVFQSAVSTRNYQLIQIR